MGGNHSQKPMIATAKSALQTAHLPKGFEGYKPNPDQPHIGDQKPDPENRTQRDLMIRKDYADGMKQEAIAKKYVLSQNRVSVICKGVKPERSRAARLKRDAEIKKDYSDGMTQAALADKHELDRSRISQICNVNEGEAAPEQQLDQATLDRNTEIKEGYSKKMTQTALADKYKLSQGCISVICKGVKPERSRAARLKRDAEIREKRKTMTLAALSDEYKLNISSIFRICKRTELDESADDSTEK